MSFRGRGRGPGGRGHGRGGGFGYDHPAKHAPHEDFPDVTLPEKCGKAGNGEKALIKSTLKLEEFWRSACYQLEEDAPQKKNEDKEIERLSGKRKVQSKREALALYLKLAPSNFPAELVQGSRRGQASNKKLRWDKDSDEQAFEVFEKLEQKHKDGSKVEKGGDDADGQEEEDVQEEEENSDDDYNQNIEFDDDDDDWNQEDEAQEDFYD